VQLVEHDILITIKYVVQAGISKGLDHHITGAVKIIVLKNSQSLTVFAIRVKNMV